MFTLVKEILFMQLSLGPFNPARHWNFPLSLNPLMISIGQKIYHLVNKQNCIIVGCPFKQTRLIFTFDCKIDQKLASMIIMIIYV